jgi:hypothetical protein
MPAMTELAQLIAPPAAGAMAPGAALLDVLEAAQRLVAYCDNSAVGTTEDAELATLGLPAPKLDRAMRDLRHSVHAMNRALSTEAACALLAGLRPGLPARFLS